MKTCFKCSYGFRCHAGAVSCRLSNRRVDKFSANGCFWFIPVYKRYIAPRVFVQFCLL